MFGGRPYPINEPVKPCGTPVPPVPVPEVLWQDGTRQHCGSFGSGTNEQETGTLSYLAHLKI